MDLRGWLRSPKLLHHVRQHFRARSFELETSYIFSLVITFGTTAVFHHSLVPSILSFFYFVHQEQIYLEDVQ